MLKLLNKEDTKFGIFWFKTMVLWVNSKLCPSI